MVMLPQLILVVAVVEPQVKEPIKLVAQAAVV
jgi:hypothetical protein